ncbi:MAG: CDP-alcohol phosphatidyltransferase family protein [Pirellulales bacterium]|nr:CDP-alcohol phosphatidyltransferase family protein [Pirellulales bacterium]
MAAPSEAHRARRHPISRWYVGPAAARFARRLAASRVRPAHLTLAGLVAAATAATIMFVWPTAGPWAALAVLAAWFFDRADGQLARLQGTASAWGAWLDANVDELVDVGLHVAVAAAAARLTGGQWPWFLLVAFLAGKYLFFRGLAIPESSATPNSVESRACGERGIGDSSVATQAWPWHPSRDNPDESSGLLRRCYHLPGNTDVRVHLLLVALVTGYLTTELALVAAYYNLRWIARYALVARRLGGSP